MPLCSSIIIAPINVLSYGENHYNGPTDVFPTIHAEDDAINKLRKNFSNRFKKIDLLVIRANVGGSVGNSKPCFRCIEALKIKLPKKGYILDTVYYTDRGGNLAKQKFTRLMMDREPHIPKFFQNKLLGLV